jgi:hypothetical protein
MSRNAFDAIGQSITGRRSADVGQTEDAYHPFALVDHRQPTHLQPLHAPHCLVEVIVTAAVKLDVLVADSNVDICLAWPPRVPDLIHSVTAPAAKAPTTQ